MGERARSELDGEGGGRRGALEGGQGGVGEERNAADISVSFEAFRCREIVRGF